MCKYLNQTWKDVLYSREISQKEAWTFALDVTFACFDIARPGLGTALRENYVHADETFRLGSFPRNTGTRRCLCHVTLSKSSI